MDSDRCVSNAAITALFPVKRDWDTRCANLGQPAPKADRTWRSVVPPFTPRGDPLELVVGHQRRFPPGPVRQIVLRGG
jgi:hypothetical protein